MIIFIPSFLVFLGRQDNNTYDYLSLHSNKRGSPCPLEVTCPHNSLIILIKDIFQLCGQIYESRQGGKDITRVVEKKDHKVFF